MVGTIGIAKMEDKFYQILNFMKVMKQRQEQFETAIMNAFSNKRAAFLEKIKDVENRVNGSGESEEKAETEEHEETVSGFDMPTNDKVEWAEQQKFSEAVDEENSAENEISMKEESPKIKEEAKLKELLAVQDRKAAKVQTDFASTNEEDSHETETESKESQARKKMRGDAETSNAMEEQNKFGAKECKAKTSRSVQSKEDLVVKEAQQKVPEWKRKIADNKTKFEVNKKVEKEKPPATDETCQLRVVKRNPSPDEMAKLPKDDSAEVVVEPKVKNLKDSAKNTDKRDAKDYAEDSEPEMRQIKSPVSPTNPRRDVTYQTAVHETIGFSPSQLLLDYELRLPNDFLIECTPDVSSLPEVYVQDLQAWLKDVHEPAQGWNNKGMERLKSKSKIVHELARGCNNKGTARLKTKSGAGNGSRVDKVWLWKRIRWKELSSKLQSYCGNHFAV